MSTLPNIPAGYTSVTPYLVPADAEKLIAFVKQVFKAEETARHNRPDGTIQHAEVRIGNAMVMLGQANEQWGPRPGTMFVYVADVDATYRAALAAGAKALREPENQPYGRSAGFEDPCGNQWWPTASPG